MSDTRTATIETSKGTIVAELDRDAAPETVDNFVTYAEAGHYDGTVFHRVIPGFMIQGGGLLPDLTPRPTRDPIQNEADNELDNERGTLAMARTSDPHSATSQFFINLKDNSFLDHSEPSPTGWGYAVFGRVVDGMSVVDEIAGVETGSQGPHQDVPVEPVLIESVTVEA